MSDNIKAAQERAKSHLEDLGDLSKDQLVHLCQLLNINTRTNAIAKG